MTDTDTCLTNSIVAAGIIYQLPSAKNRVLNYIQTLDFRLFSGSPQILIASVSADIYSYYYHVSYI